MKLGLALAGGGIKGAAHIGVLKAFEEKKIKIDCISGASSGSIVASLYAMGYNSQEILEIFKKYANKIKYVEAKNIIKLILGLVFKRKIIITGLNSGYSIEKLVNKFAENKNIDNIKQIAKPLLIPTTDVHNGLGYFFVSNNIRIENKENTVYINDAKISKVVRASCSFPFVFSPIYYKGTELVDGGVVENLPWKDLKQLGADKIIGVCFDKKLKQDCCSNLIDVATNSFDIMSKELANYELSGIDYLINIKTDETSLLDMSKIDYFYELGYKMSIEKIKEI